MKKLIASIPVLGAALRRLVRALKPSRRFTGSEEYWRTRYRAGGNSGAGSYGRLAEFKARFLNAFVRESGVRTVIEFGCGDGHQLGLAAYPSYIGFDVSEDALRLCRDRFKGDATKRFALVREHAGERADLTLSLDVIYHLVEDAVFEAYMASLFDSADRFVIVYASDTDTNPEPRPPHVRHRRFTAWVIANRPAWRLVERIPNKYPDEGDLKAGSFADFFVFAREGVADPPIPNVA